MTDPELLAKKLAFVESCVMDLRRLAVAENMETDVKERRFIERSPLRSGCLEAEDRVPGAVARLRS